MPCSLSLLSNDVATYSWRRPSVCEPTPTPPPSSLNESPPAATGYPPGPRAPPGPFLGRDVDRTPPLPTPPMPPMPGTSTARRIPALADRADAAPSLRALMFKRLLLCPLPAPLDPLDPPDPPDPVGLDAPRGLSVRLINRFEDVDIRSFTSGATHPPCTRLIPPVGFPSPSTATPPSPDSPVGCAYA